MSHRLASFKGPSTPTSSPAQQRQPTSAPPSPSRQTESTYHRKTRTLLQELRSLTETWDDLVLIDGLKAAKSLVDTRTDLDNALSITPNRLPRSRVVGPKLEIMDTRTAELDTVITKLERQFRKMSTVIENLEALVIDAHKNKGSAWVQQEALWVTWSLEKFATSISELLVPYHRSLENHKALVDILRFHSVSFEDSRDAVASWAQQPWLEDSGWDAKWEDICAAEVDRWSTSR
ncbi:hypothetical protein K435DRAFT_772236 [Dendrothele bispora CBS 962.96]|uniref:Uncharacterized protein n=1 Tax=Dendrothele bispora (strain CBS 962.96) TaxID=1314807 RepID=A0A4S8MXN9_DENBC|nr:hypothetical protein K435DRAFT_772236 [Dendrothele bispora CBS 962.96]